MEGRITLKLLSGGRLTGHRPMAFSFRRPSPGTQRVLHGICHPAMSIQTRLVSLAKTGRRTTEPQQVHAGQQGKALVW
jgi:hypothetical protein